MALAFVTFQNTTSQIVLVLITPKLHVRRSLQIVKHKFVLMMKAVSAVMELVFPKPTLDDFQSQQNLETCYKPNINHISLFSIIH